MAKTSIGNITHGARRETLTRDRNNENEDTEERALDISTMPQLQCYMQKNPTAVLEAITAYRESEIAAVAAYNEANDSVGQLQEAYEAQDETIQELNHQIIDLQGQLGEQVAIVKHQRIQLNEAAITAAAREREGTPTTVGSSSGKSTKLPDAPILTDGKEPQFTAWLIQIQGKLDANADHYPTEALKISYITTRCGGLAASNIQPRLRRDATKPFRTVNEVLEVLERTFGDPFRKRTARNEFRNLKQGNRDFNSFWSDFQRLTADMDESEETLVEDLRHKVSIELRTALAADRNTTNLFELAQTCQYIDQELRDVGRARQNLSRFAPRLASTTASASPRTAVQEKTTTTTTSTSAPRTTFSPAARAPYFPRSEYRPPRSPHTDAMKEKLMREGKCFHCQKSGHVARECPDKTSALHKMEVDGGVVLNDSEKE